MLTRGPSGEVSHEMVPTQGGEEEKLCQGKLLARVFASPCLCLPSPVASPLPCHTLFRPRQHRRASRAAETWWKRLGLKAKTGLSLSSGVISWNVHITWLLRRTLGKLAVPSLSTSHSISPATASSSLSYSSMSPVEIPLSHENGVIQCN